MAQTNKKVDLQPQVVRKTKIETTYEYMPILGEVLGWWRKKEVARMGETVEIHLNHQIEEYDRVFINGKEIKLINPSS